jgi:hypothetical protein
MKTTNGFSMKDISYIAVLNLCCTKSVLNVGCAIGIISTKISRNGRSEVVSKRAVIKGAIVTSLQGVGIVQLEQVD